MAADHRPDVSAYLTRIGFAGTPRRDLETLRTVLFHHVCAIPYENFDVLMGRRIELSLPAVEEKLLARRRGGYCFEHNLYLAAVLRTWGFEVKTLAARVRWQRPPEVTTPITHMILEVEWGEGPWLVDGGFGSVSLTGPLDLGREDEQETPHEPRRLLRLPNGDRLHQVRLGREWADAYRFTREEQSPADYEVYNWYTSTHPASRFVNQFVAARAAHGERYTLSDREFTIRTGDGCATKRVLETPDVWFDVVDRVFGLTFARGSLDRTQLEARLASLFPS